MMNFTVLTANSIFIVHKFIPYKKPFKANCALRVCEYTALDEQNLPIAKYQSF